MLYSSSVSSAATSHPVVIPSCVKPPPRHPLWPWPLVGDWVMDEKRTEESGIHPSSGHGSIKESDLCEEDVCTVKDPEKYMGDGEGHGGMQTKAVLAEGKGSSDLCNPPINQSIDSAVLPSQAVLQRLSFDNNGRSIPPQQWPLLTAAVRWMCRKLKPRKPRPKRLRGSFSPRPSVS